MRIFILISLLATLATGCHTTQKATENDTVLSILHGTSYGHCRGYCIKEELYAENTMKSSQMSRDEENNPKKETSLPLSDGEFAELTAAIDWAKWNKLENVIGCPDCADGGAEYIEIKTSTGVKRVTFDANSNPDGLETILRLLRSKRGMLEQQEK